MRLRTCYRIVISLNIRKYLVSDVKTRISYPHHRADRTAADERAIYRRRLTITRTVERRGIKGANFSRGVTVVANFVAFHALARPHHVQHLPR